MLNVFLDLLAVSSNQYVARSLETWETRVKEYEELVKKEEGQECKIPKSCKVFILRNLVPKDLEKDMLRVNPSADYEETKSYILEQASLKKVCHFEDDKKEMGGQWTWTPCLRRSRR